MPTYRACLMVEVEAESLDEAFDQIEDGMLHFPSEDWAYDKIPTLATDENPEETDAHNL